MLISKKKSEMIDHYTRLKENDALEWVYVYEEDVG